MNTSIQVLSLNDLTHTIQRYGRIRAFCPVHGSDRQRSLSIAAYGEMQGWGYCHSCKVTVLVADLNPESARRLGYHGSMHEAVISTEPQAEKWQRDELASLQSFYPAMQQALSRKLPCAYLVQRAIPHDLAQSLGIGYLPKLTEKQLKQYPLLKKWQDRLIFPYASYAGDTGYLGRSLALWKPGMDENEHKRILNEQDIRRYEKTYRSGLFHQRPLETYEHISLVEGPFDWLALAVEGFTDIVALASTDIEIAALPVNICTVTIAFDGDQAGIDAAQKLAKEMRRKGIPAEICTPPDDEKGKDWSERYRLYGRAGLEPLTQPGPAAEPQGESSEPLPDEPLFYVRDVSPYQATSWYVPGEHDAVKIAEQALAWCFQCERSTDAVEVLACQSADMFEQQPGRALAWLEALQQAYTARDQERLTALAQDIAMSGPELLALLPALPEAETQEQFLDYVNRIVTGVEWGPGVSCSVEIVSKDYIEDYERRKQQEEKEALSRAWQSKRRRMRAS